MDDALRRLMDRGPSKEEAQLDICNAIADGNKIKLRPRVEFIVQGPADAWTNHRFSGEYRSFLGALFDGTLELKRPASLASSDLNWHESRFEKPWQFEPGMQGFPGPPRSAHVWIELFTADVVKVLSRATGRLITGTGIGSPINPVSQNDDQDTEIIEVKK